MTRENSREEKKEEGCGSESCLQPRITLSYQNYCDTLGNEPNKVEDEGKEVQRGEQRNDGRSWESEKEARSE